MWFDLTSLYGIVCVAKLRRRVLTKVHIVWPPPQPSAPNPCPKKLNLKPQKAFREGIPGAVLEPLGRSWSHFVGIYCQKFTKSFKNDF